MIRIKRMIKKEASVTLFVCLAVPVLAVLILSLLEGARYCGLKADAKEWPKLAAESLFAGYQSVLLDEYGLFFLDGSFGTGELNIQRTEDEMKLLLQENFSAGSGDFGVNLFRMQTDDVQVLKYRLATDESGKVFEMCAANAMKKTLGQRAARNILDKIEHAEKKAEEAGDPETVMTKADTALKEAAEQKEEKMAEPADVSAMENPLELIQKLRRQGIVGLVLPEGKTVSGKTMSVDNCLLKRSCYRGNFRQPESPGWYERILMQEFVKPLIGNAVAPKEEEALAYGTEYLICGKGSDEENLKGVVKKLLVVREALNFLYLQQDTAKQNEALALASVLAGIVGNPAVVQAVEWGILAAWAYAESICDIKALLSGKKIPLIKEASEWNTQLSNLSEAVSGECGGAAHGLSYENYLDVLLCRKTVKQIAYRSMDLMEKNIQNKEQYANCRMDAMLVGMKTETEFMADTLFFEIMGEDQIGGFAFSEQAEYVYH